jgi:hypothetical protein
MAAAHKVRAGETLWSIAKAHFGQGHLWPSIYVYNNSDAALKLRKKPLVNPNLIHPGELIYLPQTRPDRHGRVVAPTRKDSVPMPSVGMSRLIPPETPTRSASAPNPAEDVLVPDFAIKYVLSDLPFFTQEGPNWKATAKLSGSIVLQRTQKVPLVVYSNKGVEAATRQDASSALAQLTSEAKVSLDTKSGTIKFENALTVKSGTNAPSSKITMSATSDGRLVGKASIVLPTMRGFIRDFAYLAPNVTVDLEVEVSAQSRLTPPTTSTSSATATAPAQPARPQVQVSANHGAPPPSGPSSSSGGFMGLSNGTWLMIGAGGVIVGTVLLDVATLGGNVVDNPAAVAAACAMFSAGAAANARRERLRPAS